MSSWLAVHGRPPPPPCSRPESGSSDVTLSSPSTSAPIRSSLAPSAKASGASFVGSRGLEMSGQPRLELARRPGMSFAGRRCHRIGSCTAATHAAAGTTAAAVVVRITNV
ncbi:hypothetical protein SETIT_6G076900v2 [Setaria italica]|uniref:Uncharacterized protein n=1 Tax=Setaria italica TaxID=4555 RepID=A0A368RJI6_SETIT|nr:hypothetical protein SETIT_6G076900v2 [Setaria italica]